MAINPGSAEFVSSLLGVRGQGCPHFPKYDANKPELHQQYPSRLGFFHTTSPELYISFLDTNKFCVHCLILAVPDGFNFWSLIANADGRGSTSSPPEGWLKNVTASADCYPKLFQVGTESFQHPSIRRRPIPSHLATIPIQIPIPQASNAKEAWDWLAAPDQQKPFYIDQLHLAGGWKRLVEKTAEADVAISVKVGKPFEIIQAPKVQVRNSSDLKPASPPTASGHQPKAKASARVSFAAGEQKIKRVPIGGAKTNPIRDKPASLDRPEVNESARSTFLATIGTDHDHSILRALSAVDSSTPDVLPRPLANDASPPIKPEIAVPKIRRKAVSARTQSRTSTTSIPVEASKTSKSTRAASAPTAPLPPLPQSTQLPPQVNAMSSVTLIKSDKGDTSTISQNTKKPKSPNQIQDKRPQNPIIVSPLPSKQLAGNAPKPNIDDPARKSEPQTSLTPPSTAVKTLATGGNNASQHSVYLKSWFQHQPIPFDQAPVLAATSRRVLSPEDERDYHLPLQILLGKGFFSNPQGGSVKPPSSKDYAPLAVLGSVRASGQLKQQPALNLFSSSPVMKSLLSEVQNSAPANRKSNSVKNSLEKAKVATPRKSKKPLSTEPKSTDSRRTTHHKAEMAPQASLSQRAHNPPAAKANAKSSNVKLSNTSEKKHKQHRSDDPHTLSQKPRKGKSSIRGNSNNDSHPGKRVSRPSKPGGSKKSSGNRTNRPHKHTSGAGGNAHQSSNSFDGVSSALGAMNNNLKSRVDEFGHRLADKFNSSTEGRKPSSSTHQNHDEGYDVGVTQDSHHHKTNLTNITMSQNEQSYFEDDLSVPHTPHILDDESTNPEGSPPEASTDPNAIIGTSPPNTGLHEPLSPTSSIDSSWLDDNLPANEPTATQAIPPTSATSISTPGLVETSQFVDNTPMPHTNVVAGGNSELGCSSQMENPQALGVDSQLGVTTAPSPEQDNHLLARHIPESGQENENPLPSQANSSGDFPTSSSTSATAFPRPSNTQYQPGVASLQANIDPHTPNTVTESNNTSEPPDASPQDTLRAVSIEAPSTPLYNIDTNSRNTQPSMVGEMRETSNPITQPPNVVGKLPVQRTNATAPIQMQSPTFMDQPPVYQPTPSEMHLSQGQFTDAERSQSPQRSESRKALPKVGIFAAGAAAGALGAIAAHELLSASSSESSSPSSDINHQGQSMDDYTDGWVASPQSDQPSYDPNSQFVWDQDNTRDPQNQDGPFTPLSAFSQTHDGLDSEAPYVSGAFFQNQDEDVSSSDEGDPSQGHSEAVTDEEAVDQHFGYNSDDANDYENEQFPQDATDSSDDQDGVDDLENESDDGRWDGEEVENSTSGDESSDDENEPSDQDNSDLLSEEQASERSEGESSEGESSEGESSEGESSEGESSEELVSDQPSEESDAEDDLISHYYGDDGQYEQGESDEGEDDQNNIDYESQDDGQTWEEEPDDESEEFDDDDGSNGDDDDDGEDYDDYDGYES